MSRYESRAYESRAFDPRGAAPVGRDPTDGVLGRRFIAYAVDFLIVFGLMMLLGFAILIFGLLTLGFGWLFYAILAPAAALLYSAVTIGGAAQATVGMRLCGLRVVDVGGGRVEALTAAVHALLFYVAAGTFVLWLLDLFIGLARADRRLGHDLLVGLAVVRAG